MNPLNEDARRAEERAKDPFGVPKRENYAPGNFGDMEYEFAQDRYVMERGKAYAAQHAKTGKL